MTYELDRQFWIVSINNVGVQHERKSRCRAATSLSISGSSFRASLLVTRLLLLMNIANIVNQRARVTVTLAAWGKFWLNYNIKYMFHFVVLHRDIGWYWFGYWLIHLSACSNRRFVWVFMLDGAILMTNLVQYKEIKYQPLIKSNRALHNGCQILKASLLTQLDSSRPWKASRKLLLLV